jgi:glycosyltransferase involved in cell wall biosynthesis
MSETCPFASKRVENFVRTRVKQIQPDSVLIDGTELTKHFSWAEMGRRIGQTVLVLTHNVIHQRTAAYVSRGIPLDFTPLTREQEIKQLEDADIIVAIQEEEAKEFREMLPGKRVITVPMPSYSRQLAKTGQISGRCLFVGGATQHNIDGLRWFLAEVWPSILDSIPNASLAVCGTVCEVFKNDYPRCIFYGRVKELACHYREAILAIVPLRTGSGLKIKLIEAMSYGRAVVSTSFGVQGFAELVAGNVVRVRDDALTFARAVVELLSDEHIRDRAVLQQQRWIHANIGPDRAFAELFSAIQTRRPVGTGRCD